MLLQNEIKIQVVDKKHDQGYFFRKFAEGYMKLHDSKHRVLAFSILILSGCASFEPRLKYQDFMKDRLPTVDQSQEGLLVSIEEFVSATKSKQAFDSDIASYGVLALLLRAQTSGPESYRISPQTIYASLNNQQLKRLSGEEAAKSATSEYVGKALGWTLATGPFAMILWPATIGVSAIHTNGVNKRVVEQFENLEFTGALLRPNQTVFGFAYFELPKNIKKLENLIVKVEPTVDNSGERRTFELSLPTLEISDSTSGVGATDKQQNP